MSFFKNRETSKISQYNEVPEHSTENIDGVSLHKETVDAMNETKQGVHQTID